MELKYKFSTSNKDKQHMYKITYFMMNLEGQFIIY